MADGNFYRDAIQASFNQADHPAVTLATTDKGLVPFEVTNTPPAYWWPGKMRKLTYFGRFTTAATPGNIGIELYYGTADAGGTLLASSAAVALAVSKTNISFILECWFQCRGVGPSGSGGSMMAWGRFTPDQIAVLLPAANTPMMIPATAPAAVNIDTTLAAGSGVNAQIKRSGSTADTVQIHNCLIEAVN
jgi:hypothetical protein